jgi:hypothetical protein
VSVNLEVVRSRAERPGTAASDVARFAESAGTQLTALIGMTEALLALGRSPRDVAEVGPVLRHLRQLLEPGMRIHSRPFDLDIQGGTAGRTTAPAIVVRIVLAEALLGPSAGAPAVHCTLGAASPHVVRVVTPGASLQPPPGLHELCTAWGIVLEADGHGISIIFPDHAPAPTQPSA